MQRPVPRARPTVSEGGSTLPRAGVLAGAVLVGMEAAALMVEVEAAGVSLLAGALLLALNRPRTLEWQRLAGLAWGPALLAVRLQAISRVRLARWLPPK